MENNKEAGMQATAQYRNHTTVNGQDLYDGFTVAQHIAGTLQVRVNVARNVHNITPALKDEYAQVLRDALVAVGNYMGPARSPRKK